MWGVRYLLIFLSCVMTSQGIEGYRVLFVCIMSTKSHFNFYTGITQELADRGHHVTVLTPFEGTAEPKNRNIREVWTPEVDISKVLVNRFNLTLKSFYHQMQKMVPLCHDSLRNKDVRGILREEFDLILLSPFNDCYLSVVHQLQVPFIYVSPFGMTANIAEIVGNPIFPSFTTMPALEYTHPLTFVQRTKNLLAELAISFGAEIFVNQQMEEECHKSGLCPEDMPSFDEIRRNVSLVFLNSVRELETPARPYVASVVHLGGIHCRPAKPLQKDISDWVDNAGEDGFIFFSLGTTVRSVDLPESRRQVLVKTFGSLKQRVLWKWDDESMPGIPPNVRIAKWLPQQDILGHPKLRLFITHGGLLSTLESVYHGRTVLGMPVFGDQMGNMREVESQGWGKTLQWDALTEKSFREDIISVMNNETMQKMVQIRSSLMKDKPMIPKDLVAFWTEYVIRHNGTRHLRCPVADMPWYTLYNVDVWLTFLALGLLTVWIIFRTVLAILRFLLRKMKLKQD